MINLYFNAEKQILTRTDREDLASSSREIHKCNFNLSNDWDDMQITAVFKYMGRKWDVLLADNACTVPAEVLEGQEGFTVGLYGTNGDQVITSTLITVPVSKGANASGGGNAQITPSMFDQIMAKIEEIEEGQIDPESIEAAIDEYLRENPDAVINSHEVYNAIIRSGLANLIPKYTYYTDGLEKTDAAAGVSYYVITPGHIGGYDTSDFGAIMVNVNGAAADSIYMIDGHTTLTPGKYQLAQAWSISDGISIVYSYIKDGTEIILAEVNSTNERVAFVLPEEVETEGYVTKLYIRVSQGTQYGSEILPILTYGDVTELSHIPHRYVMNNEELTEETELLKTAATNLSGSVNNLNGRVTELEEHGTGTTPVISAAATVDNTTGTPAVNVSKTGTDAAPEFTFAFTGLKGAKGDRGESGDSGVWETLGKLGAKNLIKYPYNGGDSSAGAGITYTVESDLSVTVNGTSTNYAQYKYINMDTNFLKAGEYTFSCNGPLPDGLTLQIGTQNPDTAAIVNALCVLSGSEISKSFTVSEDNALLMCRIAVSPNKTIDNFNVRAMVRYAADTNGIYEPYAMTNKELTENLAKIYAQKKGKAYGTSITAFCANYDNGGYIGVVKKRAGLNEYSNSGASGLPITNGTAAGNGISYIISNADVSNYDLITIEGGTNDLKYDAPIGTIGNMGDTNFDTTTFAGALRAAIEHIITTNPTAKLLIIADPQRNQGGFDVNTTNAVGKKLIDYVDTMKAVAELYGLPFCDWYRDSGINQINAAAYLVDGLHPNAVGYQRLGEIVMNKLIF